MIRAVLLVVYLAAIAWLAMVGLWVVLRAAGTGWAPWLGIAVALAGGFLFVRGEVRDADRR